MSTTTPDAGRGGRDNVLEYMQLGYVAADVGASVSWTIEYGQDDAALATLATALGHADDAATLLARRTGYKQLFDPATGFLWAKNADGSWASSHLEPSAYSDDFDEANGWQSVFGPWHDMPGLTGLFGGNAGFVAKLQSFFVQGKADYDAIDWTDPLSYGVQPKFYWGGNEPDIQTPYLFALAGRPDLTQRWVRWIENEILRRGGRRATRKRRWRDDVRVARLLGARVLPGAWHGRVRAWRPAPPPGDADHRERDVRHPGAGRLGHEPLRAVGDAQRRSAHVPRHPPVRPRCGGLARLHDGAGSEHVGPVTGSARHQEEALGERRDLGAHPGSEDDERPDDRDEPRQVGERGVLHL